MTDIVDRLRACEEDLMWADHAEVPKAYLKRAADEIERLRDVLRVRGNNIERLKARCVVLAAVIHSVEAWHMVPDEDQKP